jgi:ketosteroid isomerase-like protein
MNKPVIPVLAVFALIFCAAENAASDKLLIVRLLEDYKISINTADTVLGAKLWANTTEVSFIHPRGHEKGWNEIKENFYGLFRDMFKTRNLKTYNETITIYDNVALVEFYWVYDAIFTDGKSLQTKGRETQVLKKIDAAWKIIHVHYSGMPMTGEREGF